MSSPGNGVKTLRSHKDTFRQILAALRVSWLTYVLKKTIKNKLHAVSRIQQSRQKERSIMTLRSPLSAKFLKALRVEFRNSTPGFSLCRQCEEIKILKSSPSLFHTLCHCATTGLWLFNSIV